jgi:hypothetical protein
VMVFTLMRRSLAAALACLLPAVVLADGKYHKYVCITDRAVGDAN